MSRNKPKPFEPKPMFSIESEQAVIGALLLVPECWTRIADIVAEKDFFRRDHQLIWKGIEELRKKESAPDAVTLGEWFERQGLDELVGDKDPQGRGIGARYILDLANTTPSAANVTAYAEVVRDHAIRRRLQDGGVAIQRLVADPGELTPQECVSQAHKLLNDAMPRDMKAVVSAKSAVKQSLQMLLDRHKAAMEGVTLFGLSTGIPDLDEQIGGLEGGLLYVFAGPPSGGKSMLAGWMVRHNAIAKKRIAVFTIEMRAVAWTNRLIATQARVNLKHIKRPDRIEDDEWPRITAAVSTISEWKVLIDESSSQSLETIVARATQMAAEEELDLMVIDHLGLMDVPDSDENHSYRIGLVTRGLKKLAKDLNVPVVLLCQLTKAGAGGRPAVSDLADSRRIREDADVVGLICRPSTIEGVDASAVSKGYTEMYLPKCRDEEGGDVFYEAAMATMSIYPCGKVHWEKRKEDNRPAKVPGGLSRGPKSG